MRQNERGEGGRETQGGKVRKREIARERVIAREKERESEGGRDSGKNNNNMLGTYYATKCTRLCME